MKTKRLVERLRALISDEGLKRKKEIEGLAKVLKKLRKRQEKLEAQLAEADGDKAKRLKKELKVVKAQLKKGEARLEELRDDK